MTGVPKGTGIFGGTFNPIHVGHLRAAEEVAEALELTKVLFVPSAEPPHKREQALAPAALRLEWVRAAIEGNPRFEVDPLEVERGGASYSVDTLRILGERLAPERPVFIIGQDAFALLGSWREPETLFELASFAVMTRPRSEAQLPRTEGRGSRAGLAPARTQRLADWLPEVAERCTELGDDDVAHHREAGTWVRLIEISALEVSASDIRARLREGRSVRYLLPEAIRPAVLESGVYARP